MKVILLCWICGKEHTDVPMINGYKCECGGYVISPSGKVQGKLIDESQVYGNDYPDGRCEW